MKIAIVDSRISPEMERGLMLHGFRTVTLPPSTQLPEAIASHPDSLICRISDTLITTADYCEDATYVFSDIRELNSGVSIQICDAKFGKCYPEDCRMNALVMGDYLFCRKDSTASAVIERAEGAGLRIVNVKQGYPACSVLKLSENAAITSDRGLAAEMARRGIKVYEINAGSIRLHPYEYGFIGGASGVFDGAVYFFGDYKLHPSREVFERAAKENGLRLISLSGDGLTDLGGIIFIG